MSAENKILCNKVSGYIELFCYVQHHITSEIHWLLLPKRKLCQEGIYAWITRAVTINSFMVDHAIQCNPANRRLLVQLRKEVIPSYWITSHGVSPALLTSIRSWPPILDILLCRVWLLRLSKDQLFFLPRDAEGRFVTEQRDTLLQSCRHHQTSLACTVTYIRVSRTQWKVLTQSNKG